MEEKEREMRENGEKEKVGRGKGRRREEVGREREKLY